MMMVRLSTAAPATPCDHANSTSSNKCWKIYIKVYLSLLPLLFMRCAWCGVRALYMRVKVCVCVNESVLKFKYYTCLSHIIRCSDRTVYRIYCNWWMPRIHVKCENGKISNIHNIVCAPYGMAQAHILHYLAKIIRPLPIKSSNLCFGLFCYWCVICVILIILLVFFNFSFRLSLSFGRFFHVFIG